MPTPDEIGDSVKSHAQDLGRMRGAPRPRKPRGDKDGPTGLRAALAALLRRIMGRSR
jgi:hypothetical protein